jgi:non-ribosomal peptide synthetase-like protein
MASEFGVSSGWLLRGARRPDLARNEALVDIFSAAARRLPGKCALSLLGSSSGLTYEAVDRQSSRVAAALVAHGVKPGDLVGLWFRRSLELHIAMLGILKAGAAYVPFDAEAPAERVGRCLADCGAKLLVTHYVLGPAPSRLDIEVLGLATLAQGADGGVLPKPEPDDTAYVIYTSGSTGEPKGVVVTHRNACHYVRAVNETLGIGESDIVLQQASVAFDLSIEEIFVPYLVGATIKVANETALLQADRLVALMERDGITVIDTVPTLLAMLERQPRTLRLAIVGGEVCPEQLVHRFAEGRCRLINTYGPTETTVVATAVELRPGQAVTIGRPIANCTAYVVDEALRPVAQGEVGELLIGGPGVSRGYVGRPELTAAKFLPNPFEPAGEIDPVLYRTGDAVSIDRQGCLAFHGRIDSQVKIRGYRIELGEIEAIIAREPGVRSAAVVATAHGGAGEVLVAHLVASADFSAAGAQRSIAAQLPAYMVPSFWRTHTDLPRLASGKVDRKALSGLPVPAAASSAEQVAPTSLTEAHLLEAARKVLGLTAIDLDGDFFTDLGGHSLLAARFVSEVRKVPHLADVALRDVYAARSLRKLAQLIDGRTGDGSSEPPDLTFEPPPLRRRLLCGLAQAIALPFIILIVTAQWIGLLLASIYMVRDDAPLWFEVLTLCSIYVALNLGAKLVVIALKWLVIGRTRPGVYPLWGAYYFRIWLMQRLVHLTAHKFLQGSPLMRLYLRALGADIGRDAIIHEFEEGAIDLVQVGARASVGSKVRFANVEVIANEVHVGRIVIGDGAYVGNGCVLGVDTVVGEGAELGDLTALAAGARVAPGEHWDGSPARRAGRIDPASRAVHPEIGTARRALQTTGYFAAYNLVMMVGLLPIFPAFYVLARIDDLTFGDRDKVVPWEWVLLLAWPAALGLVFASMLVVIAMRWLLLPRRVRAGRHSIYSSFYFRKWAVSLAAEATLETLNSLYATVFMRNWYRLMGTRVGRGTEISTNFSGRYDLITLGENNFIGDETIFGDEEVRDGWMTLAPVTTGDRCFIGNLAVISKGSVIEDDALVGVKSRLPESLHVKAGETWFGSPALAIPNREKVQIASNWTFMPPWRMRLGRTAFEALHTSLPTAVLISLAYITADIIEFPINDGRWGAALAIFFAAGLVVSLVMMLVSVVFKWLAMGVYKPLQRPMWSWWAMRTEAVAVVYGGLSSKIMLDYVRGTPFLPWLLRLYGTRVGRGAWINCVDLTEFDCVSIGDFSVVNMHATPQTHLYEDRVMKVGRIDIGRGVTLGSGSVVLYDTRIGDFARLEPLTVVMKGEVVPAHSIWAGAPSQCVTVQRSIDAGVRAACGRCSEARVVAAA